MLNVPPSLKSKLRDLTNRAADPLGGFIYFIGLEELRADLGDRWEAKRELIDMVARRTIRATLDDVDVFFAFGECEYVVLFGSLARERALLKCSLIKADILRQFRGDIDLSALDIQTKVASLNDGDVEAVSLQDLLTNWREDEHGPIDDEVADAVAAVAGADHRSPAAGPAAAPSPHVGAEMSRKAREQAADIYMWGVDAGSDRRRDQDMPFFTARHTDPTEGVRVGYCPLVYPAKRTVSIFQCVPYRPDQFGNIVSGYNLIDPAGPESAFVEVDRLAFEHGRVALIEMLKRQTIAVVTISLSFETLSRSSSRNEILRKISEIPPEFRRYLVVNLTRLPEGMPSSRLIDICVGLKPLVRGLTAEVDPDVADFSKFKTAGVHCVGFHLFQKYPAPATHHRWISRFPWKVKKFDLNSAIWGLRAKADLAEAAQAGFEYIGGDIIGGLSDAPGPVRHFQLPTVA